jgi:hypothetical protein
MAKAVWLLPTDRHQSTVTGERGEWSSTCREAMPER